METYIFLLYLPIFLWPCNWPQSCKLVWSIMINQQVASNRYLIIITVWKLSTNVRQHPFLSSILLHFTFFVRALCLSFTYLDIQHMTHQPVCDSAPEYISQFVIQLWNTSASLWFSSRIHQSVCDSDLGYISQFVIWLWSKSASLWLISRIHQPVCDLALKYIS